ncbi:MAG: glycosyl transferase [Deltaproteobacteria bacterium]|nr:glycosyl transferase [Deltaproteobacteria bacterium]
MVHNFLTFAGALVLSLCLTPLVRTFALRTGRVAVPKDTRWHKKETALMGGVAIFVSTMAIWLVTASLLGWGSFRTPFLPIALCASGMFVLGLVDDLRTMDPQHKLAGQIVVASILVFLGFRLEWTSYKTIDLFLSIVWIVGITNAFNLLDNMDGLSAGVAFIAALFTFLFLVSSPGAASLATVLLMTASFLGALLGFLVYNFNPASIFMGDAGSLFIGFVMACLMTTGGAGQAVGDPVTNLLSVIAIPILIVFIPIVDTGFVSFMRKLFRRPISQGGKDHSSHRMVAIGLSERKAVSVLYGFSVASGLIALAIRHLDVSFTLVLIAFYLLFVLFFWIYLGRVKVYTEKSILSEESAKGFTPILVQITYRRRLFEVLLDGVLISVSYYTAYLLRFEGDVEANFDFFLKSLPILLACQTFSFYIMGVYRGVWESTGVKDLIGYVKAVTVGTVMPMLILLFIYRFESFSRAVFVIYWGVMLLLVSLSRLSFRLLDEGVRLPSRKGDRALIYGAGIGGQFALKEIQSNPDLGLQPVGFLDDNPRLRGRKIKGYPVFGGGESLGEIVRAHDIKTIIVSFKRAGAEKASDIKTLCDRLDMKVDVRQMQVLIS